MQRCQVMVQQEVKAEKRVLLNPSGKWGLLWSPTPRAAALSTV